eukprot:CAMPEP_0170195088 /NCGR_PEP_ID=MMETSP0040_2-20121228/60729_1 /TAXON_ID=641309 /ORGANISM="Lotharella oceanica, Strain CCMP622" /LENGTH=40 /DNA_ID= /DNA_START= /DNA_END= /DNA_ORIENTATION=
MDRNARALAQVEQKNADTAIAVDPSACMATATQGRALATL